MPRLLTTLLLCATAVPCQQREWFETEVRPILAQNCYRCHGPDKQKSELRLDHIAFIKKGGERGPALDPSRPTLSRLLHAVDYADPDLQMPPKRRLPEAERRVLRKWIEAGAWWPEEPVPEQLRKPRFDLEARRAAHWFWQPLRPAGASASIDQLAGPVDEARLPASRRQLLRRTTVLLTGLLPTPAEQDAWLADTAPGAHRRLVQRLLASPRFGEQQARWWMDLVRFADTLGHEFDYEIPNAWRYRDYLIRAFNQDLPYDQFVTEQIAGDRLEPPRRDPATGRNESLVGPVQYWLVEQTHAPVDVAQHTADRVANQIDVLSKTFLGVTVACARCHDHKFDAIATADYYSLYGILHHSRFAHRNVAPPAGAEVERTWQAAQADWQAKVLARSRGAITRLAEGLARRKKAVDKAFAHARPEVATAQRFVDFSAATPHGWTRTDGAFAVTETPQWVARADGRPQLIPAGWMSSAGRGVEAQGSLDSPTFRIGRRYLHVLACGNSSRLNVVVEGFHMIRNPIYGGLKRLIDSRRPTWITIDLQMWRGKRAWLSLVDQEAPDLGDSLRGGGYGKTGFAAVQQVWFSDHRRPPASLPQPARRDPAAVEDALEALIANVASPVQALLVDRLLELQLLGAPDAAEKAALDQLRKAAAARPPVELVPGMTEADGHDLPVMVRGGHANPGALAPRGMLRAVAPRPFGLSTDEGSGRLQLAQSMLHKAPHLLARVMVNRLWQQVFGEGLVATVDNFGVLGAAPRNPVLLDTLAQRFIADGWSIKRMLAALLDTRAYRDRSLRRLRAEELRDAILQCSGRLDLQMFGPGIKTHLTPFMTGRGRPGSGPLDGAGRRSVYLRVGRNFMSPFLLAFDAPPPATTMGRRAETNVPAQALALLNDPFVHQAAKRFAQQVCKAAPGFDERLDLAFRRALGRLPRDEERKALAALHPGDWREICHVIFNLKEFRYLR